MSEKQAVQQSLNRNYWGAVGIIIFLVLFGVLAIYGLQRLVIMPGFIKLETKEAEKDIDRCLDAIRREIYHLEQLCSDWALWDDTYRFVEDRNESYVKANLMWKTLEEVSGINLVMFCRLDGETIWGEAFDSSKGGRIEMEGLLGNSLSKGHYLLAHNSPESKMAGLVITKRGPLLIISRPVLTSEGKGPFHAVMLMGRFLSEETLQTLAAQTKVSFQVKNLRESSPTPAEERRLALLAQRNFVLEEVGREVLHGYAVVPDLEGKPALLITANLPREIMKGGQATARIASILVALVLVALTVVLWFALHLVESRRQTTQVEKLVEERTAELRKSDIRFDQIAEHSRTVIWEVNAEGLYTYVSHASQAILGYRPEELIGKKHFHDLWAETEWKGSQAAVLEKFTLQAPFRDLENIRQTRDGRLIWVTTNRVPVLDDRGNLLSYRGSDTDITERKRTEEEKALLEGQLLQSRKMESVGRLAGGVAHDFNNMLGVILGHAEMAMDKVDPSLSLHADLQEIHKAADRSADLTRQLLAFARKQTVVPQVLDLNETVKGMIKMLQRLIGEDIRLQWWPDANLWPIKMDPSQVDQILVNLCVNARDAITDTGQITLETINSSLDADYCAHHAGFVAGEYVRLAVSDNGCGMDKETLAQIFEPFFTTKGMGKGTGLGLASVYGAVKQNNGFINTYSEPGQGTTFTIYLPRHLGEPAQTWKEGTSEPVRRGNETILLVEDERALLEMTRMMLVRQGYTVLAANTPGEAIRLASAYTGRIHLLITDVVMPEMNGPNLAKNLVTRYSSLKCLFTSGYTANVIAHQGVLEEGVHFIQKPFSIKDLAVKVREALVGK